MSKYTVSDLNGNIREIVDVEVAGIDHKDAPDYVDAYIDSATWEDTLEPLTDNEIDQVNSKEHDMIYLIVQDWLY